MAVMKQMDECLTRAFEKKPPLKNKKWKAIMEFHQRYGWVLYLYHYHHRVLVYLPYAHEYAFEWWEKPADKRGLESAKEWLEDRWRKLNNIS